MDSPSLAALIAAIKRRFASENPDEQAAAARQGSEQIAASMPGAVMPHGALEAQRRRLQMLEEMNRGN